MNETEGDFEMWEKKDDNLVSTAENLLSGMLAFKKYVAIVKLFNILESV